MVGHAAVVMLNQRLDEGQKFASTSDLNFDQILKLPTLEDIMNKKAEHENHWGKESPRFVVMTGLRISALLLPPNL